MICKPERFDISKGVNAIPSTRNKVGNAISAIEVVDLVIISVAGEDQRVVSVTSVDLIVALLAIDQIVAATGLNGVVPEAAPD
ncbi:hypothetical protein TW83_16425 [Paracoccus sp. S4493]|nr:hypothetical protein TW83_16425 [Paracoccus sp. S4493]